MLLSTYNLLALYIVNCMYVIRAEYVILDKQLECSSLGRTVSLSHHFFVACSSLGMTGVS